MSYSCKTSEASKGWNSQTLTMSAGLLSSGGKLARTCANSLSAAQSALSRFTRQYRISMHQIAGGGRAVCDAETWLTIDGTYEPCNLKACLSLQYGMAHGNHPAK